LNTYTESVAAHIVGADRKITNLEPLHSVDIQTLVNNTSMWCDGASLAWRHAASAQRVPSCLDVTLDCGALVIDRQEQSKCFWLTPFLDVLNILLCVLKSTTVFMSVGA
jgi:hypothetical protein